MANTLGIDIGGTGIKGGLVDVASGKLVSDRIKLPTSRGGEPEAIVSTVIELIEKLGGLKDGVPVGICFPAVVLHGVTMSAANVSKKWIGPEAAALFEKRLGRNIHFVNDADAAGFAEARFGAATGVQGLVILTTLGTGIDTALIYNGMLVLDSGFGHLQMRGKDAEQQASFAAKERGRRSFARWAKRLQLYYTMLENLMSPDLFIGGGGVSKSHAEFLPLLKLRTPIVPAALRNNAGILGAAALAAEGAPANPTTEQ